MVVGYPTSTSDPTVPSEPATHDGKFPPRESMDGDKTAEVARHSCMAIKGGKTIAG